MKMLAATETYEQISYASSSKKTVKVVPVWKESEVQLTCPDLCTCPKLWPNHRCNQV